MEILNTVVHIPARENFIRARQTALFVVSGKKTVTFEIRLGGAGDDSFRPGDLIFHGVIYKRRPVARNLRDVANPVDFVAENESFIFEANAVVVTNFAEHIELGVNEIRAVGDVRHENNRVGGGEHFFSLLFVKTSRRIKARHVVQNNVLHFAKARRMNHDIFDGVGLSAANNAAVRALALDAGNVNLKFGALPFVLIGKFNRRMA